MIINERWQRIEIGGVPKWLRKEIPIYEVLEEYKLKHNGEELEVNFAFSLGAGDLLNLNYKGPDYIEKLRIAECKIIWTETLAVEKIHDLPANFTDLDEEELHKQLYLFWNQEDAKLSPPTYHNIKRLESKLKELPCKFQTPLSAIYKGNGIFIENPLAN